MREGNACLGMCIGAVLSIPIYGAIAWIVARIFRIDYWLALLLVLAVGTVAGGLVAYVAAKRAPKSEETTEITPAQVSQ